MTSQNVPVQRLKLAVLPLDLPCSELLTSSVEITVTGNSDKKKADRLLREDGQKAEEVITETARPVRPERTNQGPTAWQLGDGGDDYLHGR